MRTPSLFVDIWLDADSGVRTFLFYFLRVSYGDKNPFANTRVVTNTFVVKIIQIIEFLLNYSNFDYTARTARE